MSGKKYGLILNNKEERKAALSKSCVFGSSDEDDCPNVNKMIKDQAKKTIMKKETQVQLEKALAEDPTIFEYDSVYDDMQESKKSTDARLKNKKDNKPKYIGALIKAAEDRKKEFERRVERKVQKEREQEDGRFDDKEKFVTSAYKEKVKQMEEEREKEARMAHIEDIMAANKQKDLSGFYRHLLNQQVGEEKIHMEPTDDSKIVTSEDSLNRNYRGKDSDSDDQKTDRQKERTERLTDKRREHVSSRHRKAELEKHKASKVDKALEKSREHSTKELPEARSSKDKYRQDDRQERKKNNSYRSDKEHDRSNRHKATRENNDMVDDKETHDDKTCPKDTTNDLKRKYCDLDKDDSASSSEDDSKEEATTADKQDVPLSVKFAKRNIGEKADDARMRYLLRKQNLEIAFLKE